LFTPHNLNYLDETIQKKQYARKSKKIKTRIMPENRFYIPQIPAEQETISLEGDEWKHLMVLRPKLKDVVELVDGKGRLAQGEIIQLQKNHAHLKILSIDHTAPPNFELILAQALPRTSRLDVILEKGTELGMTELWLFPGEASEKKAITPPQQNRMQHLAIAAIKQCGRLFLPQVKLLPGIAEWKEMAFPLFFGDVRSGKPSLMQSWQAHPPKRGAIFVIGPEKGFMPKEISHLENIGAQGVTLNEQILRTDTAPLAALSLMSHFLLAKRSMI
jgi:16S rRNA (uracil1498-N3)-methyltransferase